MEFTYDFWIPPAGNWGTRPHIAALQCGATHTKARNPLFFWVFVSENWATRPAKPGIPLKRKFLEIAEGGL